MENGNKTSMLNVRITDTLKQFLKTNAKANNTSVGMYVRSLITENKLVMDGTKQEQG